eukprot:429247_1
MQAWHTEQHHINTSQYKDCWFYGKPTGCRYNKHTCRFRHKIGNNSALGTLFHLNKQMENNQVQLWQQLQGLMVLIQQVLTNQNELLSRDSPPKYTPKPRKSRSKPTASPKTKKKRKRKRKKKNSCQKKKNQQQLPRHPNDILSDISERNPSSSDDDDYPSPTDSDEYSTQSPSVTHNKSFDVDDNHSSTPPPNLKPKTTNMGGQLSSEDVAMDGVTAAAASGGSKRHCECKEPQRIAVTAVQNPKISQRVGPRQISQNPPSYSPPRYPKHPSQDKKKKKKTQTKKKVLNPYAHVFSKGGLYDTGYKDTKCKDKMKVYPPPKARSHTRQTTGDFTPKSKPKPSQYLASIGLHIQPKQPKNPQHNIPPKSLQKKAIPPSYSPPSHPQNTGKLKQPIYGPEVYWKHARNLITEDTDEDLKRIIIKYDEQCSTHNSINTQLHPNSFMTFVMLETLIDGNYTEEHMDIDDYFEKRYPKHGIYVPPISSDTTFSQLINETFRKLDEANIKYNDTALFPF